MAKKKAKKTKGKVKTKKSKKVVKAKVKKKVKAKARRPKAVKVKKAAGLKEKVVGKIEHFFGHISVMALKLKAPLKVGDYIHIVGPHNDFVQRVDSMQIEHQSITAAKAGDDVGMKVAQKVRVTDTVYLAAKQTGVASQPSTAPAIVQKALPASPAQGQTAKPSDPYGKTRFLNF